MHLLFFRRHAGLALGSRTATTRSPKETLDTVDLPSEQEFVEGAAGAVEAAIVELHSRGIATTHFIDGLLVRVHPDGRREDLGALPSR
jgi:hypothetical protein